MMPTVIIDGCKVRVERGATILDAAKKAGIWIPTLCYHPAVSCDASCRLCMVELDHGDWSQLVTACNYPVRRDITVYVSSERAEQVRRGVMQLLLARAPDSEELKALAEHMGVEGTPYPNVTESQRNCVLCGLCVRVCEEIIGKAAISFAGRGVERAVAAPFRQPSEDCIGCGACAAVCPVGTIKIRLHEDEQEIEISPFKSRRKLLTCERCGASIVSTVVSELAVDRIQMQFGQARTNLKKFRQRVRLCPRCKRAESATSLGTVMAYRKERVIASQDRDDGVSYPLEIWKTMR